MPEEDQPPEEIWLDSEATAAHFEWVRSKYAARGRGEEAVPDPRDFDQNEMTKGMR